jgi:nucleotide-binding universal stress UspA family protein
LTKVKAIRADQDDRAVTQQGVVPVSYRTILVHLNDSRRARKLLHYAAEIARAFEARLIGLHVSPTFHGRAIDPNYPRTPAIEGLQFSRDEEADCMRSIFEDITDRDRFKGEFRLYKAEQCWPLDIVAARAHAADLVVASQTDPQWGLSSLLDYPEHIALASGRPLLVVPNATEVRALPKSAIIAWNQRPQATRAMYEALPLLREARTVELLVIEERDDDGGLDRRLDPQLLPMSAVAEALAAHGIRPSAVTSKSSGAPIGSQICARAEEQGADLVVMGAYGHSRLRELVLGGATQHMLSHMTVPTFFSH